jgi:hypothetical protein
MTFYWRFHCPFFTSSLSLLKVSWQYCYVLIFIIDNPFPNVHIFTCGIQHDTNKLHSPFCINLNVALFFSFIISFVVSIFLSTVKFSTVDSKRQYDIVIYLTIVKPSDSCRPIPSTHCLLDINYWSFSGLMLIELTTERNPTSVYIRLARQSHELFPQIPLMSAATFIPSLMHFVNEQLIGKYITSSFGVSIYIHIYL